MEIMGFMRRGANWNVNKQMLKHEFLCQSHIIDFNNTMMLLLWDYNRSSSSSSSEQTVHVRQSVPVEYDTGTSLQRLRPENRKRWALTFDFMSVYTEYTL